MTLHALSMPTSTPLQKERGGGVTCVRLTDFRSYEALRLECDPRPVVLTGQNGAGKTNLLEALSFLTPGRGLRSQKLSQMLRQDRGESKAAWYISVDLTSLDGDASDSLTIGTGYETATHGGREKRLVKIDGDMAKSQTELSLYVSVNWLTPQMDGLFQEGSGERRKFLDRLISAFDGEHASRVHKYEYGLRERSRLLRQGIRDDYWLKTLEETMASSGTAIAYARQEAVASLSRATDWALGVFPRANLRLEGLMDTWIQQGFSALDVEERLKDSLRASRTRDAEQGSAQEGPHRTDMIATYAEKGMVADQCSTGEQKALLISLIMASVRVQSVHRRGVPLLLLDEVVAHLDEGRRRALYDEIRHLKMQVWMTGTDKELFVGLQDDAQYFMVEHSQINPQDR